MSLGDKRSYGHKGCDIKGCMLPHRAKGFCRNHYRRFWLHGDPMGGHHFSGNGYIDKNGYKTISVDGVRILEHRWVMQNHLGRSLAKDEVVHHLNGERSDNRFDNLELWHKGQPSGQRVEDKIQWAKEFLSQYGYKVVAL